MLDHDPIGLNRIMIASVRFQHDLFGKPVPTFPDHALALFWRRLSLSLCPGILLGFPGFVLPEQRFLVGISRQPPASRSALLQDFAKRFARSRLGAVLMEP